MPLSRNLMPSKIGFVLSTGELLQMGPLIFLLKMIREEDPGGQEMAYCSRGSVNMNVEGNDEKSHFNGSSSENVTLSTLPVENEWELGLEKKARRK